MPLWPPPLLGQGGRLVWCPQLGFPIHLLPTDPRKDHPEGPGEALPGRWLQPLGPQWVGANPALPPGLVPTAQGLIVQPVHALGPTSQLAKTRLGLLAAGYFESTKNDFGGVGGIAQEKHYYSIIFFLKCKQLNLEKQNQF